ncbi:chondroitinase family polysaccharide lyase [Gelidibacter salicanalis]|uniref:Ig-like domain-containing protein n=1 Tax=Gelidibacter salicanalis TaxID=291193 RepID=A0A934NJ05_9FLAO|nr:chondroitinase family polysaccharide lyase [Gelidibacter salicanalis]MBJ7882796.1 Ig-like domain-containing protein [Gelidibacter salicanalis]
MKNFILLFILTLSTITLSQAQIGSLASNNWTNFGNTEITFITTDGDNGDGVNDGAQKLNNLSSGVGHGMSYNFNGTMLTGESLAFETYVFNPNVSYVRIKVELINVTDNVVLANSGTVVMSTSGIVQKVVLNYTPLATDNGDQLQLRYTRVDDGNAARTFAIDNAKLNGSYLYPEGVAPPAPSCFTTTGNEEGWARIGDVTINAVTNDGDNGDGLNDGALAVVSLSSGVNEQQGTFYTFDCAMIAGETLQVATVLYNSRNSYVAANMQLYNSTDGVVLASTGRQTVAANGTTPLAFSYITQSSDVGDELQLRILRSDDGNPVRSFSIDYGTINGATLNMLIIEPPLNPACANGIDVNPDIPLSPVTPQQVLQAEKVYQTLSDTYLGTVAPSNFQGQMDRALQDYDQLEITVNGNLVNGKETTFKYAGSIIEIFAKHLKLVDPNDTVIVEKASNLVALVSQQFCKGTILLDGNAYDFEDFSRPTIYLKDYLSDAVKDQYGYVLDAQTRNFFRFWDADYQEGQEYNTDWMFNMSEQMILYGAFRYPDNDEEKVRYMKAGKRFLERFLTHSDGTGDGLKPDGTGFHHWFAYDGYMYALTTVINNVDAFNDTEFQIDPEYYYVLRNAIYAQKMFSNDAQTKALSMSGRNPQIRKVTTGKNELAKLAISGGKILGLSTADPLLAGYYNRVWGTNPKFNSTAVTPFEEGFIQLNYAQAGVYRKDNWVAVMKGFGDALPGSELYPTTNRYGRYQSYGTLEILYPGGIAQGENAYDVETWDWNYNPGATTIVLPWEKLHGERSRLDEVQQKSFVGALAFKNKGESLGVLEKNYGTYGLFAMDFQELENQGFGTVYGPNTHNATFTFKKSNFAFKDFIVSLGSGISNNDVDNPTVTTLYQRTGDAQSGATVNATFYDEGINNFSGAQDNWVISDHNTGFYVVSGSGALKIWKGDQQTPNHNEINPNAYLDNAIGTYTKGYIDHGNAPVDTGYEYVTKPNATASDMQAIAAAKPYTVLEKSSERHVVKHNEDNIWGYSLFNSSTNLNHGIIKANDAACLVMYEEIDDKNISLSMTDPDLALVARSNQPAAIKTIVLTLHGEWSLSNPHSQVTKVIATDSTTTFQFRVEHAMPVEVDLIKTKTVKKVHITPAVTRYLEVGDTYNFTGFVTPTKATDVSLVWRSNNETVATVDQQGKVTAEFVGNATITCTDEGSGKFATVEVIVNPSKADDKSNTSDSELLIYPNSTTVFFTAKLENNMTSYKIYDYIGNVRQSQENLKSKELVIQVDRLIEGVYILQVTDDIGATHSKLFIKK